MSSSSDAVSTRDSLYKYYKATLDELRPQYLSTFDRYARDLKLSYERVVLEIDDDEWRPNAYARRLDEKSYRIGITRGLFERLIYLVNLLVRVPQDRSVLYISGCDFAWKDPEASLYDYRDDSDLPILNPKLRPLLAPYTDVATYERDFDASWGHSWPAAEVENPTSVLRFYWVINFVVFHEMSHILQRHLDKCASAHKLGVISETAGSAEDPLEKRRLMEGQADFQATTMLVYTLRGLKEAARGDPVDATMQRYLWTFAFLMFGLFAFWGKTRKSLTLQDNFLHPHPDFRRLLFIETVDLTLRGNLAARKAWHACAQEANHDIQNAYHSIGAPGVADTVLNEYAGVPVETLHAWQAKVHEKYREYYASLSDFSQYMKEYMEPVKP